MPEPVLAGPEVIDLTTLQATGIAMVVLASAAFFARTYLGIIKKRVFSFEDGWLIAAYVFFLATSIMYLYLAPFIFKLQHIGEGRIAPYPTMLDDVLLCRSVFFFTTIGLSACLYSVKASLLSLYKRLLQGGAMIFVVLWWVVVTITGLSFVATITAGIMSCESPGAWFTADKCDASSPRNARATYVSLFLGTACDIFTNLLIMFLPLALIRNLQMHWKRKLTVGALFCLGWVCIATATIRAAYLGSDVAQRVAGGARFKVPSPPWLALWAMVESAVAIIIACGPGLYREIQVIQSTRKGYENNGYQQRTVAEPYYQHDRSGHSGRSAHVNDDDDDLNLGDYPRATTRIMNESSSQEELVRGEPGKVDQIMVTRSVLVSGNDTSSR
ncbi:hypothetical protein LIA77_11760 [Sarocladium implicatum]|nr:hypothetical protein LIA77_11760 [Sarocladium implicatum]